MLIQLEKHRRIPHDINPMRHSSHFSVKSRVLTSSVICQRLRAARVAVKAKEREEAESCSNYSDSEIAFH
jgi:hypothetical protein